MSLHPQVAALLERVARSPLPPYHSVPAFVARRIYRDTRSALAPRPPEVAEVRLRVFDGTIAVRSYRPVVDEILPALVFFHGGGWTSGDLDTHDAFCRSLTNGARCEVFSVEYRLAPEAPFPAAVEDCIAATEFVLARSSVVAVGGDSAGGNLAAVVALTLRQRIAFQLLIYPATDQSMASESLKRNGEGYLLTRATMERFRAHYLPQPADWLDWRASPALAKSHAGLPPAFVLTAGFDPLCDEGRQYAELLARAGVEVEYRNYPDMIHGFILMGGVLDTANAAVEECCAALRRAFEKVTA